MHRLYGSLNRSRARAVALARRPHADIEADAIESKVKELQLNLRSVASTGTNDRLLSHVCMAITGPLRRYDSRYRFTAERVVLFKHLIASGFPIEVASSVVKTIQNSKRASMIDLPIEKGITTQLRKTVEPTKHNIKVAGLIWLFAHVTAYCTLRQLKDGYVRMGDDPCELDGEGIYVFDQDHVGLRHASGQSAYMPFARIVELLALRDCLEERFRG